MERSGSLAVLWARRACRCHAQVALAAVGDERGMAALGAVPEPADATGWRALGRAAEAEKARFSLDEERRRVALRAPETAEGATRAWIVLHLVGVVAGSVASYLCEGPSLDTDDAAVIEAWVQDSAQILAGLAGGEAGITAERARQEAEASAGLG